MNWEKLDLHLENLIPGVVLLAILLVSLPVEPGPLATHEAILAAAFVAAAYMLGAVGNVFARMLLEYVSRNTVRAPMFRLFLGEKLGSDERTSAEAINRRYSDVITAGLTCGNPRVEAEVAKRRQTCRMLRSTLIPTWIILFAAGQRFGWHGLTTAAALAAAYMVLLGLYAYAEATIFQEGYRGWRIKSSGDSPVPRQGGDPGPS